MAERRIAYVLKGYPRLSELFIASEIWRLEQLGVPLRLYVLKPADETVHHPVVDRIATAPSYLPVTTSLSGEPLLRWLRSNLRPFLPSLQRMLVRHPLRLGRAYVAAAAQAVRARQGWRPRKIYLKELLQATVVADDALRAGDVSHLHAHFAHGTTTVTWLASMMSGLPFSFTAHAKDIYRESLNPAGLLARKMRAAEFVVTCTDANRAHLQRIAPNVSVHLVYHGLNADFARLLATVGDDERLARSSPRLRIASVGRLVAKKGFDILIAAVAQLREQGTDVELFIAGENGDHATLVRALVAESGLSELVRMTGPLTQREILALYRGSDVFALACRVDGDGDRDGIPNVMVEAMAAGLPVVTTAVSGIPELVHDGDNGLLVPPDDASGLADAILLVAKDPQLQQRLSANGSATVAAHFDGDVLARRMAALFAPALRRQGRR